MTPDELRALADALEPMARAPRFEDFDVPAFCAWVRACADAKPVAWIVEHGPTRRLTFFDEAPGKVGAGVSIPLYTHPAPAVPAGWKLVPVEATPEMLLAGESVTNPNRVGWYDADIARAEYRAMLAAAPAAPQAEPKREQLSEELKCCAAMRKGGRHGNPIND